MANERYRVELTRQAEKDLRRLRSTLAEATEALLTLETDPEAGERLAGSLQGVRSLHWRVRGTEYRAAYVILEDPAVCAVFQVGARENFYREATRRREALEQLFTHKNGVPSDDADEAQAGSPTDVDEG